MKKLSRYQRWYGRDDPPARLHELRAGPVELLLEGIDLRYVRVDELELARRVHVAVRDTSWATVPAQVSGLRIDAEEASFEVLFRATHVLGDLSFSWQGTIAGGRDGVVEYTMDGMADAPFDYNRIGFCVLHPREVAGCAFRLSGPGRDLGGYLPDRIGQQRFENGRFHPLLPAYDRLQIVAADGAVMEFIFEGDLFEMEDQRNWTDASFKTYSTPPERGWPHHADVGQRIRQVVRITAPVAEKPQSRTPRPSNAVEIEIGAGQGLPFPEIGVGTASEDGPPGERESGLLRAAGLAHLRVDLHLDSNWQSPLQAGLETARVLDAPCELAVFIDPSQLSQLDEVARMLAAAQVRVCRVFAFETGRDVSDSRLIVGVRDRLRSCCPEAAFAVGTNLTFAELNRERPSLDEAELVVYPICATIHADDDTSVRETPAAQGDTVRSARALAGGQPVAVSPVTFRPRIWPHGRLEGYAGLPFQVDPRQCSLFGAAWTVASIKYLAEAGAAAVTYFETLGWRGLLEPAGGAARPSAFASWPGQVFPLYHVLADVGDWRRRSAQLVPAHSSDSLTLAALAADVGGGLQILIANLEPRRQTARVRPVPGDAAAVRILDEDSFQQASSEPESFRATREMVATNDSALELQLEPYAVARVSARR